MQTVQSCFARVECGFLSTFSFALPELHKTGTIRKHWNRATKNAKTGWNPQAVSEIHALVCGLKIAADFVVLSLANTPEATVPLIKGWNACMFFLFFQ